jgi:ribosomal protein S18 acetylase RimI-like enzyme
VIETSLVRDRADLEAILALQRENLRGVGSAEDEQREGFVTVVHTIELLEAMHAVAPSVIAREDGVLAGYALVMPVQARGMVPILDTMFDELDKLEWRGRRFAEMPYYVMGQICVARAFRGRGVVDAMYREHRARYADRFAVCVTEIATRNTRSIRVHERVGFEAIHRYKDFEDEWAVVAWDWRDP